MLYVQEEAAERLTRMLVGAMNELRLTPEHKDLLMYFHSMIVDPEGHKKWMDEIRARQ